jgi:hypothetical protein
MGDTFSLGSQTTTISDALCYYAYASRKTGSDDQNAGPCVYQRVESGVDLGTLCGTTTDAIEIYNPNVDFSTLAVGQPICCSEGVPPNFMPSENANGSCAYYTIQSGDSCETLYALYYPITEADLMEFNTDTFNWYGCTTDHPQVGDNICLSPGTPPRPTPNPLAQCGPLAPGDLYNTSCPLNACCDQWGFCGETVTLHQVQQMLRVQPAVIRTVAFPTCRQLSIQRIWEPLPTFWVLTIRAVYWKWIHSI